MVSRGRYRDDIEFRIFTDLTQITAPSFTLVDQYAQVPRMLASNAARRRTYALTCHISSETKRQSINIRNCELPS